MKNELMMTPIATQEIPARKTARRNALMKSIRAFYEGEYPAVEVDYKDHYRNVASAANACTVASKKEGLSGFVRVIQRGDRLFLARKFARVKI